MTQTSKNRIKVLIPILICLIGMIGILVYGINHYRQLSFQHISNLCQTIIEAHPEAEEEVLSSLKEYSEGANQGVDLCQYLGHKKLNFFSLPDKQGDMVLSCKSLIFNLLWCLVTKGTVTSFSVVK